MEIQKTFRVAAPRAEVWSFVTNAEQVATCIPGIEEVLVEQPGRYKGQMKIKVGPIRTTVRADVIEVEQRAPELAVYSIQGEEGGRASRLNAEARLALAAVTDDQTEVSFSSNVVIVGRLGKFAGGVMNKLADSMSEEFITAFRSRLEPQPVVAPSAIEEARPGLWARFVALLRRLFGGGGR